MLFEGAGPRQRVVRNIWITKKSKRIVREFYTLDSDEPPAFNPFGPVGPPVDGAKLTIGGLIGEVLGDLLPEIAPDLEHAPDREGYNYREWDVPDPPPRPGRIPNVQLMTP